MADNEKKIFIDEDWKSQVQREKEELAAAAPAQPAEQPAADDGAVEGEPGAEASLFVHLMTDIATQALFALGLIAPEGTKQVPVDLGQAKYLVDTLLMLREKTEGHRTDQETGELNAAIAELQRLFVARSQQLQEAAMKQSGVDLTNLRNK
jgi:hypothetical protein